MCAMRKGVFIFSLGTDGAQREMPHEFKDLGGSFGILGDEFGSSPVAPLDSRVDFWFRLLICTLTM